MQQCIGGGLEAVPESDARLWRRIFFGHDGAHFQRAGVSAAYTSVTKCSQDRPVC